jgi:putative DNA primase/helicase
MAAQEVPNLRALLASLQEHRKMDLQTLRRALGGEIVGRQLICPGPGHSPKDRSLSITISPSSPIGFLCHSFAGDDWRECQEYVCDRLGLKPWSPDDGTERVRRLDIDCVEREVQEKPRELTAEDRQRIARALEIWNQGVDPRGTLAERYLNHTRMLKLPDALVGKVLRFHPRCPWRDENTGMTIFVPALIAAFRSIDTDEVTAVHRIALNPDGTKRDRRMFGIVRGTAVKLDPAADTLAIGEGIETAMAGRELGVVPSWALGSVGAISRFPILDGVKALTIIGEAGEASADAAKLCASRWRAAGRRVRILMPDAPHSDLNDELMNLKAAA